MSSLWKRMCDTTPRHRDPRPSSWIATAGPSALHLDPPGVVDPLGFLGMRTPCQLPRGHGCDPTIAQSPIRAHRWVDDRPHLHLGVARASVHCIHACLRARRESNGQSVNLALGQHVFVGMSVKGWTR
jgi:hypothetical protein